MIHQLPVTTGFKKSVLGNCAAGYAPECRAIVGGCVRWLRGLLGTRRRVSRYLNF